MGGLAMMAWKLAQHRVYPLAPNAFPASRDYWWKLGPSAEYYRIIDRIARGEKP